MTHSLGATNLAMVRRVAERPGDLRDQVVFLGGAATALLITDTAVPDVRATIDVDLIVELASRGDYYRFAEALRSHGFTEHLGEDAPVCRWRVDGVTVDIMPTSAEILGFSNRWYSRAMQSATAMRIADSVTIRVVTAPCFIATKLDAFWSRGKGDFMASQIWKISSLGDSRFLDALPGHLLLDQASQQRITVLKGRMRSIADILFLRDICVLRENVRPLRWNGLCIHLHDKALVFSGRSLHSLAGEAPALCKARDRCNPDVAQRAAVW